MEEISRKKEVVKVKTLTKEFDLLQITKVGVAYNFDSGVANSGWRQLAPLSGVCFNDTYFDLAGLSMDAKTLFFEAAGIQEAFAVSSTNATVGDGAAIMDIMTTSPLTDTQLSQMFTFGNLPGSQLNFEQTVYFRYRVMNFDLDRVAGGYMVPLSDNQLGSLKPTATDRIYCYRVVSFGPNNADATFLLSGARYMLKADAKEEPEFEYLMRLKRSYDLQNEPDVD